MKGAFSTERFKQAYDLAPANYRVVVEAYAETIGRTEQQLAAGRPIGSISRGLFIDGLRDLVKRKTVGMLWSVEGLKNLASLSASAQLLVKNTVAFSGMIVTPIDRRRPRACSTTCAAGFAMMPRSIARWPMAR